MGKSFASNRPESEDQLIPPAVLWKSARSSGLGPGAQEALGEDAGDQEKGGGGGAVKAPQ